MKISAAAAVVALVALSWLFTSNNTVTNSVVTASNDKPINTGSGKNSSSTVTQQSQQTLGNESTDTNQQTLAEVQVKSNHQIGKPAVVDRDRAVSVPSKNIASTEETTKNVKQEAIVVTQGVQNDQLASANEKALDNSTTPNIIVDRPSDASFAAQKNMEEKTVVSQAVYREIDTNEEDNSIYIGGAEINKNKLRGLFKKAAKFLGKKGSDNQDDKTVRIAGFEVKTK